MTSLFNIGSRHLEIMERAEANDGELTPGMIDELNAIGLDEEAKVESYVALIRQFDLDADMREAQYLVMRNAAEQMAKSVRQDRANADRLRSNLLQHLLRTGQKKISAGVHKVSWQLNPPTVDVSIVDAKAIADQYPQFVRISVEFDREKLKQAAKTGGELPKGIRLIQHERLVIK